MLAGLPWQGSGDQSPQGAPRTGARVKRLVYASSVAAYGFHSDNPELPD